MINALRVTLANNVPYENVSIYSTLQGDAFPDGVPNLFEDSQVVIVSRDGRLIVPHYQITLIHLTKGRQKYCDSAFKAKRIRLSDDQCYEDCSIIPQDEWARFDVPHIFHDFEQLVFCCKDGLFITCDWNVMDVKYR